MIRGFAVKFPRYAGTVDYEHELTWFDLLVLSKFESFYGGVLEIWPLKKVQMPGPI